jgi:prepilin-type N-terminal cleavage/methylation domain-containing protein
MRYRYQSGASLIEVIIVCVIIGVLAGAAVPIYSTVAEKGRAAEAREILFKSYAGFQRLLMDEEGFGGGNPLTWFRLGMGDPNTNARRFFDYYIRPNPNNPDDLRAERRGDASKWLEIDMYSGVLTKTQPY